MSLLDTWTKLFSNFQWQNRPSTSTPLGRSKLQLLNDAIDGIDDRVLDLKGGVDDITTALDDKVDKVEGKGLSTEDFTTAEKTKLAGISAEANKVEITPVVTEGTTLATISIDGVDTAIKGSDVDVDSTLSPVSTNPVENKVITAELNKKADSDEPIKTAYSLAITTPIENESVYMKRKIPVKNSFMETLSLVGATVNANQLVQTTDTSATVPNNHKYLARISGAWSVGISDGTAITVDGSNNDMIIDLTAYFGSTAIADKVYTMEQTESGSGIAWLKSHGFFTEDYIGYRANGLASVNVSEKINVGKNICDNSTNIVGYYNDRGVYSSSNDYRSSALIEIKPNTECIASVFDSTYQRVAGLVYTEWDANGDFISQKSGTSVITTKPNTKYIRVRNYNAQTDLVKSENYFYQLEIGSTATSYEPYTETHIPFDTTKTLRGRYTLDGDDIKADGDIYKADGTITRKYAEIDLSQISWTTKTTGSTNKSLTATLSDEYTNTALDQNPGFWGNSYSWVGATTTSGSQITDPDNATVGIYTYRSSSGNRSAIYMVMPVNDSPSGKVIYPIATPTTESATPFTANQQIDSNGTEEFVDYGVTSGDRDFVVPVGNITEFTQKVEIPSLPNENGEYTPKLTVSDGGSVWSWVSNG